MFFCNLQNEKVKKFSWLTSFPEEKRWILLCGEPDSDAIKGELSVEFPSWKCKKSNEHSVSADFR